MDSHIPQIDRADRDVPASPSGTSGTCHDLRARAGPVAVTKKNQPLQICPKCGSSFRHNPHEVCLDMHLCLACQERYVRICTACNKPYRTDKHSPAGGLCPTCYYLVYDDDEESD